MRNTGSEYQSVHFGIPYTQNHVPAAPSMIAGQRQHSNAHW
jgi:hypothetical protein